MHVKVSVPINWKPFLHEIVMVVAYGKLKSGDEDLAIELLGNEGIGHTTAVYKQIERFITEKKSKTKIYSQN